MKNVIWIATAVLLAGCARGGGIGLEAMLADYNCEQAGYQLGTPQYAACRAQIGEHQRMVNAAMAASYQRQIEQTRNRQQTCSYGGGWINCW